MENNKLLAIPKCPRCGRQLVYHIPGTREQLYVGALYNCPGRCGYSVLLPSAELRADLDRQRAHVAAITAGKYQVITYSPDNGADERPEHATIKAATAAARRYITAGHATAAIIYNTAAGRIVRTFGDFPQSARPTER